MRTFGSIELNKIGKTFGATKALADVCLRVRGGDILGIVGANGAGKSTLVKILQGEYREYDGKVTIDGQVARLRTPSVAHEHGIAVVSQELLLFRALTVAENVALGRGTGATKAWRDDRRLTTDGANLLSELAAAFDPRTTVAELAPCDQQLVHIARGLARSSKILLLDEATNLLSRTHAEALWEIVKRRVASGAAALVISHNLDEILNVCTRVCVLRDGRVTLDAPADGLGVHTLRQAMFGNSQERAPQNRPRSTPRGAERVTLRYSSPASSFDIILNAGDAIGLVPGQDGSAGELLRAAFGASARLSCTIMIAAKEATISKPADALALGVVYLSADRQSDGLFANLSVAENACILALRSTAPWRWRRTELSLIATRLQSVIRGLNIKVANLNGKPAELSGGNQQKLLLARLLMFQPRLLLLDDPLSGVDVNGRADLFSLLASFKADGGIVLIAAAEENELPTLCDRILKLQSGGPLVSRPTAARFAAGLSDNEK